MSGRAITHREVSRPQTFISSIDATTPPADDHRPGVVVASVPSGHVYVRHLAPEQGGGPVRLPDPPPTDSRRATTQQWWPPAMLDPRWVEENDFDVMHLHFGFDSRSVEDLGQWVDALRRTGRPLVYTVHDLRNPHHEERTTHDDQLDVLIPAADQLITLTDGAADEIRRRWHREAIVLPHPHVVPFATMSRVRKSRLRADGATFTVGLHLKSLRPSMAPQRMLPTLVDTVRELPGAVLRVNVHRDVMEPSGLRHDRSLAHTLSQYAATGDVQLQVHDYFNDDELWSYLAGLDVSVLPYRFGTHSGWLEACRDLGTTVIAPTCGYFSDQGPVLTYRHEEELFHPQSLADALRTAYHRRSALGTTVEERRAQRRGVAVGHDLVYRALMRR